MSWVRAALCFDAEVHLKRRIDDREAHLRLRSVALDQI
jgi:hypothetical protein